MIPHTTMLFKNDKVVCIDDTRYEPRGGHALGQIKKGQTYVINEVVYDPGPWNPHPVLGHTTFGVYLVGVSQEYECLSFHPARFRRLEKNKTIKQLTRERDAAHARFREKSDALLRAQQLAAETRITTPESKLLEHHNL